MDTISITQILPEVHVWCGISTAFHNKECRKPFIRYCKRHDTFDDCWAYGNCIEFIETLLGDLLPHVLSGNAITLSHFKDGRRIKANFQSAGMLGLDLDKNVSVEDALADPFIHKHAFLVYPTPSSTPDHPRTRVLFVLSEPVRERERWEAIQRSLIAHFAHLKPDEACKDCTRIFFGGSGCKVRDGR